MKLAIRATVGFLSVLLAGCASGSTGAAVSSPSPAKSSASASRASPSPSPGRVVIALLENGGAGSQTLRFVDRQGNELGHAAVAQDATVVGTVDGKVALWDRHTLRAVAPDGQITDIEQGPAGAMGVFLSPDGTQRLWLTEVFNGSQVHSTLSVSGHPVMDGTELGRYLRPVAWTARGVMVEHMAIGIGGYILFQAHSGAIDLLDLATDSQKRLGDGGCTFQAIGDDGTLACSPLPVASSPSPLTLRITPPGGAPVNVALPPDRFNQAGDVSFAPGTPATRLVFGGSPSQGMNGKPEQYETDVVDVATGAIRQLASGVRPASGPWAWLPDGNLLCYTPPPSSGQPRRVRAWPRRLAPADHELGWYSDGGADALTFNWGRGEVRGSARPRACCRRGP